MERPTLERPTLKRPTSEKKNSRKTNSEKKPERPTTERPGKDSFNEEKLSINFPWGHVSYHTNLGPDRFSRFDIN